MRERGSITEGVGIFYAHEKFHLAKAFFYGYEKTYLLDEDLQDP